MPRVTTPTCFSVYFPLNFQPAPFGGSSVVITQVTVATNAQGQIITPVAHQQFPLVDEDVTDELIDALNAQLAGIGLNLSRSAPPEPAAAPSPAPSEAAG